MEPRPRTSPWVSRGVAVGGVLIAMLGVWWLARSFMGKKVTQQRPQAQQITMIRPPPPEEAPPPPPPPEEKVEEPLPQDTPDPSPTPDNAPEQLGVDADASAGGDAFGLAARRGGADLVGTGTAIFGRYTAQVAASIKRCLEDDDELRLKGAYEGDFNVTFNDQGRLERLAVRRSTGHPDIDALIVQSPRCRGAQMTDGAPPIEMPRQVNVRLASARR